MSAYAKAPDFLEGHVFGHQLVQMAHSLLLGVEPKKPNCTVPAGGEEKVFCAFNLCVSMLMYADVC
jgi:hypothetical protein